MLIIKDAGHKGSSCLGAFDSCYKPCEHYFLRLFLSNQISFGVTVLYPGLMLSQDASDAFTGH